MKTKEHIRILTEIAALNTVEELRDHYNDNYSLIREMSLYSDYETRLGEILHKEFNLSEKQAGFIMGEAYSRYQSCFSDIFHGAKELALVCIEFGKIA